MGFNYSSFKCRKAAGNMKSVNDHKEVIDQYIQGEREAGRLLGHSREARCQVYMSAHLV